MKKFNPYKIQKETLKLCKEIAESREYITAPLIVYIEIRSQFTIAKKIDEIIEQGFIHKSL